MINILQTTFLNIISCIKCIFDWWLNPADTQRNPAYTRRNNNVIMTTKLRRDVILLS